MKEIVVGSKASEEAISALREIAEAVGTTLGPNGLPVIYDELNVVTGKFQNKVTKDGITVLNSLEYDDAIHKAVLDFSRRASSASVIDSGDGTTSTIVLAYSLAEFLKGKTQADIRSYKKEIEAIIERVNDYAIVNDEVIEHVVYTSSNSDPKITEITMEALNKTNKCSSVVVSKNPLFAEEYKITVSDRYAFGRGYANVVHMYEGVDSKVKSNEDIVTEMPIVLYDGTLSQLDCLEHVFGLVKSSLCVICYQMTENVIKQVAEINKKGTVRLLIIPLKNSAEANGRWHIMGDLSALTGATLMNYEEVKNCKKEDVGFGKIEHSMYNNYILGRGNNLERLKQRIRENDRIIEKSMSLFDKDHASARNASLADGLVTIELGGAHMEILNERADRLDDALKAGQSCIEHGACAGCGQTYITASFQTSLYECFKTIQQTVLKNAGYDIKSDFGLDTFRIEDDLKKGDAVELRVLDSVKTVKSVIKNAFDLAVLVASTKCYTLTSTQEQVKRRDMMLMKNMYADNFSNEII